ncbi:MAG TPA: tripartite tricarboxylate transporter substrate binding protein [Burkholderiales bacterium]|nr:tripartite tricarboxylate transporter substrate binding protein [Burkholderiales bacterium]
MGIVRVMIWAALLATALAAPVSAQTYPSKPIRLVVPYPPGGGSDIVARPLAQLVSASIGQQVVIDNRSGAGGNIGMEFVAKAPPDGYTLIWGITAQLAVNPSLYPKLNYDLIRDFAPISLMGIAPYLLVAHPALPVKSVNQLVALARAKPGEVRYGSAGNGSGSHLAGEMLNSLARINTLHIPYKGGAPAMTDLVAGQLQLSYLTYTSTSGFIRSGRLRALGVTTAKRSAALPDLPAISEAVPGYDSAVWYGLLAPAGTPADIIARLNREFLAALKNTEVRQRLMAEAFEPIGGSPEYLGDYMKKEIARWAKLVKETGTKID